MILFPVYWRYLAGVGFSQSIGKRSVENRATLSRSRSAIVPGLADRWRRLCLFNWLLLSPSLMECSMHLIRWNWSRCLCSTCWCWCYQSTVYTVKWSRRLMVGVCRNFGLRFTVCSFSTGCDSSGVCDVWVFEWRMTVAQVYVLRTKESVLLRSFLWHHRRLRWN